MSTLGASRSALYARLHGDPGLAAYQHASMAEAGVQVWRKVPASNDPAVKSGALPVPRFPRIVFAEPTEGPLNTLGREGGRTTDTLDVWDNYGTDARVLDIFALITAATVEALEVPGFAPTRARQDFAAVIPDPDGLIHGIYRLRKVNL